MTAQAAATDPTPAPSSTPEAKRSRAKVLLPALAAAAALAGAGAWLLGRGKESTDDAFVEAHVANVAARTQGQVAQVLVKDNQEVKPGDVLVLLDDRDAKVKLAAARADLESASANEAVAAAQLALIERGIDATMRQAKGGMAQAFAMTGSSKAAIDQARADVDAAEARRKLAGTELERSQKLLGDGAVSQAELDAKKAQFDQALAALEQAKARLDSATVGLTGASGTVEAAQGHLLQAQTGPQQIEAARAQVAVAKARVAQAQAALDAAELNLSYVRIVAPSHGIVSRRTVEVGQMVDPSRPLMALTGQDEVWVVANFKEDQVAEMKSGQAAKVTIDTFSGRTLAAHVDSLAGGTGSRFSLLPPDNASGNFTKVVQRVPVLVRFDDKLDGVTLRPGLSAYVTVYTKAR